MEQEVITACDNVCRDFYWIGPVTEWLRNVAIIFGVMVAYFQLNAWRREHLSKRKAETAELLLSRAMDVKSAISSVRSPMESVPVGSEDRKDAINKIKWDRLLSYSDSFNRLRELQVLHEALVGTGAVQLAVDELFDVRQEVYAALSTLNGWNLGSNPTKENLEFHDKLHKVIYAMGAKYDLIEPRVKSAIGKLREELLPEIRMEK